MKVKKKPKPPTQLDRIEEMLGKFLLMDASDEQEFGTPSLALLRDIGWGARKDITDGFNQQRDELAALGKNYDTLAFLVNTDVIHAEQAATRAALKELATSVSKMADELAMATLKHEDEQLDMASSMTIPVLIHHAIYPTINAVACLTQKLEELAAQVRLNTEAALRPCDDGTARIAAAFRTLEEAVTHTAWPDLGGGSGMQFYLVTDAMKQAQALLPIVTRIAETYEKAVESPTVESGPLAFKNDNDWIRAPDGTLHKESK